MKELTICGIQISIEPNKIKENTEKCCDWIEKVCSQFKPDLIVFPETVLTGFTPGMNLRKFHQLLTKNIKNSLDMIKKVSKNKKVWTIWPSYEPCENKLRVYNTAFLISSEGKIIGKSRKNHISREEYWTISGEGFKIFNLSSAKIGVIVCSNEKFSELSRFCALKGAEVIIRPSAVTIDSEIWFLVNRARAFDNKVYVVSVNLLGRDAVGKYYFGHSMIVDPTAKVISRIGATEGIVTAKITL